MAVAKDLAIKLFGRTISLSDNAQCSDDAQSLDNGSSLMTKAETEERKNESLGRIDEATSRPTPKVHREESAHGSGEPKPLFKRPDKILPCPRCYSSETKFCYFNNYNVNQPRHFCKSCQRYWTAGGTVRNVPVGAGRRRNKHLASQYRQIIGCSDGGPTSEFTETNDSASHHLLEESSSSTTCTGSSSSRNEMVLKFGPDQPHCDSTRNLVSNTPLGEKNGGCYEKKASLLEHYALPPQITTPLGPNISLQFVPASYWNCIPVWVASPPLFRSENGLQVLGKHPRESNLTKQENVENGFSAAKTLRIHDLDQA